LSWISTPALKPIAAAEIQQVGLSFRNPTLQLFLDYFDISEYIPN
jgi:hypothetical protein